MKKTVAKDRLAVFDGIKDKAARDEKVIRNTARLIADWMAELHGEPFRVVVDHQVGMILVRKV